MVQRIIEQLEKVPGNVLNTWESYWHSHERLSDLPISRQESAEIFFAVLRGLRKITGPCSDNDSRVFTHILTDELSAFWKIVHAQKGQDCKATHLIYNIKAIRSFFENISEQVITEGNLQRELLLALGRLFDCIEIELLQSWDAHLPSIAPMAKEISSTQKLANEKAKYKSIFDTTSNLVLITDENGHITEINPEAKRHFSDRNIIDQPCWEVLGLPINAIEQLLHYIPQDTVQEITIPFPKENKHFSLQIKSLSRLYPGAEGALLILSDISFMVYRRKDLESSVAEKNRDLLRSQLIIDTIFQSVGQGILLLDHDLEVIEANLMASEMFGVPLEVLVGTQFQDLTDDDGLSLVADSCDSLSEGGILSLEISGHYVDGRQFPCMVTMTSMDLNSQKHWPIIVSDITRQKDMEAKLVNQRQNAEEMNTTLRNVLATIEEQRKEVEQRISSRIRSSILPGLERIERENDEHIRLSYLTLIKDQLTTLTADFDTPLDHNLLQLSKTELRICQFIKAGLSGKEICSTMNLAFETIQSHRKNIRRKLGLRGQGINLYAYLAEINLDPGR